MLVAFFRGGGDAVREDLLGFGDAGFAGEELGVHQIRGNVVGITFEECAKMHVGGCGIAAVHAFHGKSVAGEGVFRFHGDELFKRLAAGFILFGHWVVPYYTGARGGVQTQRRRGCK